MTLDATYLRLGKLTEDMHIDYKRAISEHKRLVNDLNDIDEEIKREELSAKKDLNKLSELYKLYRENKAGMRANQCYRQGLFDKFNTEVDKILYPKEWTKDD